MDLVDLVKKQGRAILELGEKLKRLEAKFAELVDELNKERSGGNDDADSDGDDD